jgi:hypothetical protein
MRQTFGHGSEFLAGADGRLGKWLRIFLVSMRPFSKQTIKAWHNGLHPNGFTLEFLNYNGD